MKFPLQKGSSRRGLETALGHCTMCKKPGAGEPLGFAWLNAGALLAVDKSTATADKRIKAFFSIGYHGRHDQGHDEPGGHLEIVQDPAGGQFEFYFCSTGCLRHFFSACVDELENRIE